MQNKILIPILLIIGGLALLVIGFYGGLLMERKTVASQLENALKVIELTKSKVIPSIIARGKITNISDRTITLTFEEDSLAIPISETANIVSFVYPEKAETIPSQAEIEFKDIKVGDSANITLRISSEGEIEGTTVLVFPKQEGQ